MMTPPDRDRAVEQWLRQTPIGGAGGEDCLDADKLAAWAEGSLDGADRSSAERHASRCTRCQAMLAVMVRTTPAAAAAPGSPLRKWLLMLSPAMAAAAAVALWFAVGPERQAPSVLDSLGKERASAAPREANDDQRKAEAGQTAPATEPLPTREIVSSPQADALQANTRKQDGAARAPALADARRDRAARDEFAATKPAAAPASGVAPKSTAPLGMNEAKDASARAFARANAPAEGFRAATAPPPPVPEPVASLPPPPTPPPPAPQQQLNQQQLNSAAANQTAANQNAANSAQNAPAANQAQGQERRALPIVEEQVVVTGLSRAAAPPAAPAAGAAGGRGGAIAADALTLRLRAGTFDVLVKGSPVRWRVVDGGTVQRSTDAGVSWSDEYRVEPDLQFTAGFAPSASVCWLVGRSGLVAVIRDGRAWERLTFPERVDLGAVAATDGRNVTVTTTDGRQYATADGGRIWTRR